MPTRKYLKEQLLPTLYYDIKNKVKSKLDSVEHISLTTDTWTSRNGEGYMSLTAHFINEKWEMESCLLECFCLTDRHTAENLSQNLLTFATDWNIKDKVDAVITDGAANMAAAIRLTKWLHLPCLAHKLNLVAMSALKVIVNIHDKAKNIVNYFHRSTVALEKFKSLQLQMNVCGKNKEPLKLINDVCTRWKLFICSKECVKCKSL